MHLKCMDNVERRRSLRCEGSPGWRFLRQSKFHYLGPDENDTIKHYRARLKQCESLQEYAIAEDIREILRQEQEHQIDLATALGEDVPDVSKLPKK